MGIFEKFYQMQNVEDVDGNGIKEIEKVDRTEKKSVLSFSITRAQSTFSTKCQNQTKNVENVEKIHVQKTDYPPKCPFNTGGTCPPGCRFETRFFRRMLSEGVLQVNGPCPVRGVCLMDKFSRETGGKGEVLNTDPSEWEETLL